MGKVKIYGRSKIYELDYILQLNYKNLPPTLIIISPSSPTVNLTAICYLQAHTKLSVNLDSCAKL